MAGLGESLRDCIEAAHNCRVVAYASEVQSVPEGFRLLDGKRGDHLGDRGAEGAIGELRSFRAEFTVPRRPADDIRYQPELGGGALLDTGVYPVRAALHLLGPDVMVVAARRDMILATLAPLRAAVNAAGIPFSGYPGLIARLTNTPEEKVFMMLVGGGLRILHATLHERIHHALARLTPDLIEEAGLACAATLQRLGIAHPRIGIFGINPHAGENGLFGDDDDRITVPAVARLRKAGVVAEGPVGADIILGRKNIDGFVAIYHDQGHIPVKLLAGRNASALSVGAGVLFSSVGHGSAFDIAGEGKADPSAVLRTLLLVGNLPAEMPRPASESAA